ncbi:unnamed protein product [Arctia plantaginis]|uniref:PPIase cyclophilin-type domain-containing protein n=1 Tax=Arctia plantaginis TaxID=874455 RepID=A0A8S1BFS4_ARCPL|nr:unnamed protein product [Arctia plantaginis]
MTFFNPGIILKEKPTCKHPWEHRIKAKYSGTYKHSHNSVANPSYPAPKTEELKRLRFIVIGNRVTKEFIYCMHMVRGLHKCRRRQFEAPIVRGVSSVEWPKVWNDLKIQFGEKVHCIKSQVVVLLNNEFLGGEQELLELIETKYIYNYPKYLDFHKEGIEQFSNYIKSSGRPCAFLHIAIDNVPIGPLIFMLYADLVPFTCENFIRLCELKKNGYAGAPIHRIVQDSWIQCGGFALKNPTELDCENYIVPHDRRGVLAMANAGRNKDCSTQFFVLLQPALWMKNKYVAFGQLIEGEQTLKKIESVPTWYESPTAKITIYKAGVFNMECHWKPINKTATEYISGHIEDLVQLGALFYEALLEKLYAAIEEKKRMAEEFALEEAAKIVQDVRSSQNSESVNDDFDVDEYEEYESEEEGGFQQASDGLSELTPKSSRIVEKPYYLPLTDVPYPGEVESAFNLQRLLRGDYCLETDLEQDREKRKQLYVKRDVINVPDDLLDALFEFNDLEINFSEMSLELDEENDIREYIKENVDTTSFGGSIIKKIANEEGKFDIFNEIEGSRKRYTDEDLRLFRITAKEIKNRNQKKRVSISTKTATPSHTKIHRRPTGFVRPEDIEEFEQIVEKLKEAERSKSEIEALGTVRVAVSNKEPKGVIDRRPTGYIHIQQTTKPRASTLSRLYDDVSLSSDGSLPTLMTFKPASEMNEKYHYRYLTNSPTSLHGNSNEKYIVSHMDTNMGTQFLEKTLDLQHGRKLTRKVSSDYARTMTYTDHEARSSLRTIEFARQRPSMSIVEYKMKNQKYQDELKAAKSKTGKF